MAAFSDQLLSALPSLIIATIIIVVTYFLKKFGLIFRFFHKVDKNSTRHGGELVAEVLKAHNIKHIFCLSGGHISPILVACEKTGIRVVDTRHEVNCVFAADAVARLSGTIGVATVTAGPGVTNTVTAIKNAQMAESPVLLIGGAAATLLKGRGALQDIEQIGLFKSLCKFTGTARTVREIVPLLKQAIYEAMSGTPGPVFVEFPIDVLYPFHIVQKELGVKDGKVSFGQKIVNWYLQNHIDNLYAGAWEPVDKTPIPPLIPVSSPAQIRTAAQMIKAAKKPVILMGSQAVLPPMPAERVREAIEQLGIPCFLGGMSRGLLGRDNKIQLRHIRRDVLKDADLVILAGSVCDFRLSYGRVLSRRSKIIAVNRDREQMMKNSDMFWKPTLAVQSDVGSFLVELQKSLSTGYRCDEGYVHGLREKDNEKDVGNRKKASDPTELHLNPVKVLTELDECLDDNSILVADGGDFVGTAAYILRPRGPLRWLDPGAFGTLGVGGGFAMGAKLVRPDCDVWIIYGDGSCGYSIAEFDTFTRHKLPIIAIVGNDAGWTQISREQVPMFGSNVACGLEFSDYHTVAAGFGGHGVKLDRGNVASIRQVYKDAISVSRKGKSVLINALLGRTNFRDGSISV